jgi:hypothetical protein
LANSLNEGISLRNADLDIYLHTLVDKADKKVNEMLGKSISVDDWMRIIGWVTDTVLRGCDPVSLGDVVLQPTKIRFPITITSIFSHYLTEWLTGSSVLTCLPVVDDLICPEPFVFNKLAFTNYALLCKFAEDLNVNRVVDGMIKGVKVGQPSAKARHMVIVKGSSGSRMP